MAEYIEREALQAALLRKKAGVADRRFTEGWNDCLLRVKSMVHSAPAADVAPVRHGRWGVTQVNGVDAIFACSECSREVKATNDYFGKPTEHIAKIYPYCHCGAKMDLEGGNDAN